MKNNQQEGHSAGFYIICKTTYCVAAVLSTGPSSRYVVYCEISVRPDE